MKKPLRRSATFWCGLFVLIFLSWAAVDSLSHRSMLRLSRFLHEGRTLEVHGGVIAFKWEEGSLPPGGRSVRLRFSLPQRWRHPAWKGWFPAFHGWQDSRRYSFPPGTTQAAAMAIMRSSPGVPVRTHHVQVPLWPVLLLYGMLWCLVLRWRSRRGGGGREGWRRRR